MLYKIAVLFPAVIGLTLLAQSPQLSWTELNVQSFSFVSFANVPAPTVLPPYEFSLPDPEQQQGASSEICNARENPNVDLYRWDPGRRAWAGPLEGPVYRSPTDSFVGTFATGRKGIAAHLLFTGKGSSYNGNSLAQAVFFHDEPCYRASTEFGFFRYVKGLPADDTVYFYYEINANCTPSGKCRTHGTSQVLNDQQEAVPLPPQPGFNSRGGADWLYVAYLINGGAQWRIEVLDPYTFADIFPPLTPAVKDFFARTASDYDWGGANGYITATSTRSGTVLYSGEAPTMKIVNIFVAK